MQNSTNPTKTADTFDDDVVTCPIRTDEADQYIKHIQFDC